jgi:hypothetical protein
VEKCCINEVKEYVIRLLPLRSKVAGAWWVRMSSMRSSKLPMHSNLGRIPERCRIDDPVSNEPLDPHINSTSLKRGKDGVIIIHSVS